jgi:glycosyltransferase involved in cell wall biosynthesis
MSDSPVLILSVDPAWPPVSGADLRNWRTALAAVREHPVVAVSLWSHHDAPSNTAGVQIANLGGAHASEIYRKPPHGTPIDVTLPEGARQAFIDLLRHHRPGVVIFESLALRQLLDAPELAAARVVLDMHNIESALFASGKSRLGRLLRLGRKLQSIRAAEQAALATADEVWVCSALDRDRLERLHAPAIPVHVVQNSVPSTFGGTATGTADRVGQNLQGPRILFVGHLSYRPNVTAAEWLAKAIMPALRRKLPGASLVLAGRSPHRRVRALAASGIEVFENPASLAPVYASTDIAVVPLRSGGGTRIKVIEAMAAGLPVVATGLAVEGLGLEPGHHYLEAETAHQHVAGIVRLWEDPELCTHLISEGEALVGRRYSPEIVDDLISVRLNAAFASLENP